MRHLPDILAVIGAALIISGVALMHIPTAIILSGSAVIFAAYTLHKARP